MIEQQQLPFPFSKYLWVNIFILICGVSLIILTALQLPTAQAV